MMNLNSAKQSIWFIVLVTVVAGLVIFPAISRAVTVGPVKLEYTVDPGKTLNGQLFLQNDGSVTQTFYPSFEKFTEDSSGQRNFTKEESDLAIWFHMVSSVRLAPGESHQIPFKIEVPKNAPPGGHFAVIWWSTTPPGQNSQQVSIVTRAGVLVFLTVTGDVHEVGSLQSFFARYQIFTSMPLTFSVVFSNSGNTYLKPIGTVQIKNIFGGVSAEGQINEFGSNIFPQMTKTLDISLNSPGFFFGLYHAVANVTYGEIHPQSATAGAWIIIAPWGTLVGFVVLLFIIFFVIPRGIKKYNAWIISKARR